MWLLIALFFSKKKKNLCKTCAIQSLLENWLVATDFLVVKWDNSVAKIVCDRFGLSHIRRLQIYLRLILWPIQGDHVPCLIWSFVDYFATEFSFAKFDICDRFFNRKFQILRPKNRSQIYNFCGWKIGCKCGIRIAYYYMLSVTKSVTNINLSQSLKKKKKNHQNLITSKFNIPKFNKSPENNIQ